MFYVPRSRFGFPVDGNSFAFLPTAPRVVQISTGREPIAKF
jgi:hypothetical protein